MKKKGFSWFVLVILLAIAYYAIPDLFSSQNLPTSSPAPAVQSATTESAAPGAVPILLSKQTPGEITFQECPPGGDSKAEAYQNELKNRVDTADYYYPVDFQSFLDLTWPKATEATDRDTWSTQDASAISRYEGVPISVEGYLAKASESGKESTNCHKLGNDNLDWHLTVTQNPGEDRSLGIVMEATPRVRPNHSWTLAMLQNIVEGKERIRISGWLFFDPEHPNHLGKYRATLWEIHPITKIEVFRDGKWVELL